MAVFVKNGCDSTSGGARSDDKDFEILRRAHLSSAPILGALFRLSHGGKNLHNLGQGLLGRIQ